MIDEERGLYHETFVHKTLFLNSIKLASVLTIADDGSCCRFVEGYEPIRGLREVSVVGLLAVGMREAKVWDWVLKFLA